MGDSSTVLHRLLAVAGLGAIAVTGPVLDIYGRTPEVFVANQSSPLEIVLFAFIAAATVPVVAGVLLALASAMGERGATITYHSLVVILSLATGLVVARQLPPDDWLSTVLVTAGVAAVLLAIHRWARGLLRWAALVLPIAVALFVFATPSSALIWGEREVPEASGTVGAPASIVLIQLDEMPIASIMEPGGAINATLFPNFARLASEGTWYRNALSSSIATTQSIPAILTGRLGEKGLSPSSVDHPDNLFTLLGSSHEMHVIEWVADMCPEAICPDYAGRAPARFSSLLADVGVVYLHLTMPGLVRDSLPSIDNAWKGFLGQDAARSSGASAEIEGLPVPPPQRRVDWADYIEMLAEGIEASPGRPVLSYAHLEAPHVPWETNPSGTHYDRPEEYTEVEGVGGDGRWSDDPRPALLGFQRHLLQIGFLDTMLGRLFAKLDETGAWEETMVIVIADHGASFVAGEHRRWPYEDNRDDLYRVPMFVKYPGQTEGEVVDAASYGIDLLPTIVDALGIQTNWAFDGVSLLEVEGTDRPHTPIWWCCSDEGASTDLSILYSQVERNHEWVPDQRSWMGVAGAGSSSGLVGEPVSVLPVSPTEQLRWSLDLGSSLLSSAGEGGIVQTLLTGRLTLPSGMDPDQVLVSVNGTVAGGGFATRDSADGASFRAIITEELVRPGVNELDVLVSGDDGIWLSGGYGQLTLELTAPDGHQIDLQPEGSKRLQVDETRLEDDGWVIEGWAADVNSKSLPLMIYVFAGDELITYSEPNRDNKNVVRWFGSEDLLRSGFELEIPIGELPDGVDQVLVVAEFDSHAIGDPTLLSG